MKVFCGTGHLTPDMIFVKSFTPVWFFQNLETPLIPPICILIFSFYTLSTGLYLQKWLMSYGIWIVEIILHAACDASDKEHICLTPQHQYPSTCRAYGFVGGLRPGYVSGAAMFIDLEALNQKSFLTKWQSKAPKCPF